jgi:hypothetical protein
VEGGCSEVEALLEHGVLRAARLLLAHVLLVVVERND